MRAIVATDNNWNIGKDGDLLFHIKEDMKFFKEQTIGKAVVMGRKTLESLPNGNPLPDRANLVLSKYHNCGALNTDCFIGNKDFIDKIIQERFAPEEVYVIGGAEIYNLYLNECDVIYRTMVDKGYEADRSIPPLFRNGFQYEETIKEGVTKKGLHWHIEKWVRKTRPYVMTGELIMDGAHLYGMCRNNYASDITTEYLNTSYNMQNLYDYCFYLNCAIDESCVTYTNKKIGSYWRCTCEVQTKYGITAYLDTYGDSEESAYRENKQCFYNLQSQYNRVIDITK